MLWTMLTHAWIPLFTNLGGKMHFAKKVQYEWVKLIKTMAHTKLYVLILTSILQYKTIGYTRFI